MTPRNATIVLLSTWGLVFWPDITNMLNAYINTGYDYQGFIVPIFILFACKYGNTALKRCTLQPTKYAIFWILLAVLAWFIASLTGLTAYKQAAMLSIIPAIIYLTCGKKVVSLLSFQLSWLIFMLPIGQEVFINLQNTFAALLVKSLSIIGQQVYWDGNKISLGTNHYIISSIFISLQFFMSYLTFGAIYSFITSKTAIKYITISSSFLVFPFILILSSSWLIILTGTQMSPNSLMLVSWVMTTIGILCSILLGYKTYNLGKSAIYSSDIDWQDSRPSQKNRIAILVIIATCIIVSTVPLNKNDYKQNFSTELALAAPQNIPNWGQPISIENAEGTSFLAEYRKDKQNLFLSCSDTRSENPLSDIDKHLWQHLKSSSQIIKLNSNKMKVSETILRKKGISRIIWTFYNTNGRLTSNNNKKNFWENLYGLSNQGIKSTTISIATHVNTDLKAGRETLTDFLNALQESKPIILS